jgi:hypothetical protein
MATYKLIQDIEAEDHILGPLTFRQFVFALIAVFLFYIVVISFLRHWYVISFIFLPPALFFGFFALPFGRDQPTEVWALAKIRFWFKPRKRVWNQSGVKELVTITAPKKVEPVRTNGLSQNEVQSRLKALADTIDTRGWATKNIAVNAFSVPAMVGAGSDRLIDMSSVPQQVNDNYITEADDILDERNNPIAQQFQSMIAQSEQAHRQQIVNQLNSDAPAPQAAGEADYWFMNGSGHSVQPIAAPQATSIDPATEAELASELKASAAKHPAAYGHMRTVKPLGKDDSMTAQPAPAKQATPVTPTPDPAILSLANNDDLNVATLAHEAKRAKGDEGTLDKHEVSISLH